MVSVGLRTAGADRDGEPSRAGAAIDLVGTQLDPGHPLLGLLADTLADRLAERLAPQLVAMISAQREHERVPASGERNRLSTGVARSGPWRGVEPDMLWTARAVAAHYSVAASFVYQHAEELGCLRLGGGKRPRLRFDPRVVRERWPRVGGALPAVSRQQRRPRGGSRSARRGTGSDLELLDFDREP